MAESIGLMLARKGFDCNVCVNRSELGRVIASTRPDIVVTGVRPSGAKSWTILEVIKKQNPDLPVVIVTGFATVDAAVEAMKRGAADFICKPFHADELFLKIQRALTHVQTQAENSLLRHQLYADDHVFPELLGRSSAMKRVFEMLERVHASESCVFLTGESGTGKELVARVIHRMSARRHEKFFPVNCAGMAENLLEREVFGHEKQAYAGAASARRGLLEMAEHGTLYLKEVGETSLSFQASLLNVLEHNEFHRVGGNRVLHADVRVIASSRNNLDDRIASGAFRKDLYYRLCVVRIHLPSLRERKEDIPLLVDHFLHKHGRKISKRITGVSAEALQKLEAHSWPGNIRELENVLERAVIMAAGQSITPADLLLERASEISEPGRLTTLEAMEKQLIERTLVECRWNKSVVAKKLGIGRRTLYDKASRFGIGLKPAE